MANLVTASSGTAHITPKMDAIWHRGMMGVENCILDYGQKLAPALVSGQPTNIRILDGCAMFQGRFFEIDEGSYDTVAIQNGAQGYKRIDIVCAKITQNENGTQTFSWEVVKGTQTTGNPVPPTVTEGSLDDGDSSALMPIASVELNGVNIVAVETVAEIGGKISDASRTIRQIVPLYEGEHIEVKKLLWENPNPAIGFPAQTMPFDLSGYDAVEIVIGVSTGGDYFVTTLYKKGRDFHFYVSHMANAGAQQPILRSRFITVYDGGIEAGNGRTQQGTTYNSNVDSVIIPIEIYGIKHI